MPMSYYKTFMVPYWVVVDKCNQQQEIFDWFKEAKAKFQLWPNVGFDETVMSFKKKGWSHIWDNSTVILSPQLVVAAINKHIHDNFNPFASFDFSLVHRIDRKILNNNDYTRIIDEVLGFQDPIVLSQLFQVAEICYDEAKRERPQLWISSQPCDISVISKVARNVISIGIKAGSTVNVRSVKPENLSEFLSEKMLALYKTNDIK